LRGQIGDDAFFKAVRLLIYGRNDPKPGNFSPRYSTTKEFIQIVNQITKKDWNWFFNGYLRHAALPDLVVTRIDNKLRLKWQLPDANIFPLPVEVQVNQRVIKVPMDKGQGEISLPAHATYTIDPGAKLLKHEPQIDVWSADVQARARAARAVK
jgi:aminopeptidase N